jgi:hypothetical protein
MRQAVADGERSWRRRRAASIAKISVIESRGSSAAPDILKTVVFDDEQVWFVPGTVDPDQD